MLVRYWQWGCLSREHFHCLCQSLFDPISVLLRLSPLITIFILSVWKHSQTHARLSNCLLCTLLSPLPSPVLLLPRLWTLWLLTWMWRSAASPWCPETVRRTAAWMCCPRTARWPFSSPQRERAATTSMQRSQTASSGLLPLWWRHTHCPAQPPTSGGSCMTTAAPLWWCSISSTSPTQPG